MPYDRRDGDRRVTLSELRGGIVVLACAISAGIHGALAPAHFDEGMGAGVGFVLATLLLAVLAVVLTLRPERALALAAVAAVLVGLLASYALAVTTGLPLLHPEPEPVEGLALATKAIEAAGLVATATFLRRPSPALFIPRPKGTLT
jgi:hypothetical protein